MEFWPGLLVALPERFPLLDWLRLAEYEVTLFCAFWFVIGVVDELAADIVFAWLKLVRRVRTHRLVNSIAGRPLGGSAVVLIPAWQEAGVIGATIDHMLKVWPQPQLRLYIGCYSNDPATLGAAMAAVGCDHRVRLVINERPGPTTKADCLNRLYHALELDEDREGFTARMVLLHDAEDMVHPAALPLIDAALTDVDFIQIPVRPEPMPGGHWIAGHYIDEFTEAHARTMVVRDALGAALPAAGVGCAFSRGLIAEFARGRIAEGEAGPFAAECLTEDYELGLKVKQMGGRSRFLRMRDCDGSLIATRSYFPAELVTAVRQKTRWIHGIAFQGWERMGWSGRAVDLWMAMRDRRGPLVALVLGCAYVLLAVAPVLYIAEQLELVGPRADSPLLDAMVRISFAGLLWRAMLRFVFTAREYGVAEGGRAVLRIPVANVIAIMAGRRALAAYWRSLSGAPTVWDKTAHLDHPALARQRQEVTA